MSKLREHYIVDRARQNAQRDASSDDEVGRGAGGPTADEKRRFKAAVRDADKARKAKVCVTCPASRHVQMMAEYIGARKGYAMLSEEPEHCAESMLSVVASLYEARARISQLEGAKT
jgi:hypothetical protein